jgi:hypothetical protein
VNTVIPDWITIPDWLHDVATATTENEQGDTVTQHTGWRAVLDPSHLLRHPHTCAEWDLTIVADDAQHGPGLCDTNCHEPGDRAINVFCMSVPQGDVQEVVDAAVTALAEHGFCINGPWLPQLGGTLAAVLMPAIQPDGSSIFETPAVTR